MQCLYTNADILAYQPITLSIIVTEVFMHTNCQLMKQSTIKNCRGSLSENILKKTGPVLETINCCPVANQWKESKRKLKMMWIQRSGDNMTL